MAAMAGVWNHAAAGTSSPIQVRPQSDATNSGASNGSSTESAKISANDFLTLLVTELQNQDPTSQTDPNEYVNQLVAVNSLEQLININQTLGSALGTPTSHSIASPALPQGMSSTKPAQAPQPVSAGAPGNIASRPAAADRVSHALSGVSR